MTTNKTQKWNFDKHQQNTMSINRTHKWTLMNNKAHKKNVDEQQQNTTRNNVTRNSSKIQTMNINQAKQKINFKFKTHQAFSLFIKKPKKKKG
jgi:hypothetical protein